MSAESDVQSAKKAYDEAREAMKKAWLEFDRLEDAATEAMKAWLNAVRVAEGRPPRPWRP